jgi:Spy/CpxP family protein refolding chaperone
MFLLGVFLTGGAVGFTADRVVLGDRIRNCTQWGGGQKSMRDRLADDLCLSDAQRAELDRISDERHRQMSALLAPVRPQMDSISEATRGQIRAMLTPEQRVTFEKIHREQAARNGGSERR